MIRLDPHADDDFGIHVGKIHPHRIRKQRVQIRPLGGTHIQVVVGEAPNVGNGADQVRAVGGADEVGNADLLNSVRANRPMSAAAGIGVVHVHRVPDDCAGRITNVLGIKRINGLRHGGVIHSRPRHIRRSG